MLSKQPVFPRMDILWVDYIYLDIDERRRFAQTSHEYLIETLQYNGEKSLIPATQKSYVYDNIHFNHPIKELFWVAQPETNLIEDELLGTNDVLNFSTATTNLSCCYLDYQLYTNSNDYTSTDNQGYLLSENLPTYPLNPIIETYLEMNGQSRFSTRSGDYFNLVQPSQNHTSIPVDKGINVYSFALRPEDHQPSGTCNLSRIDDVKLYMKLRSVCEHKIRIYALGYNVLRILSGMAGLAFAN